MHQLILLRHGESQWNKENLFTGWTDIDLSEAGREESLQAGRLLKTEKVQFDVAYTSVLKRAIRTLWILLDEMDLMWIPVHNDWRLNERHYGALQGLDKAQTAEQYGDDQVRIWRRSYEVRPPQLSESDPRHPRFDPRYRNLRQGELPTGECLKDTVHRFLPCWDNVIVPALKRDERPLIVAHGNSLRALIKHLERIPDEEIVGLEIPTGVPLLYELDDDLKPLRHRYLVPPAPDPSPGR